MSWTRLDDAWTDLPELAVLDLAARWHYLALIQFCSRTKRYDGVVKVADARRCSDVEDPSGALAALAEAGLVVHLPDGLVKVSRIDDHIPPPSVRENAKRSRVRMQRYRKHQNGDHSTCLPENCEHARPGGFVDTVTGEVTAVVTRNTGTGQDRTGQDIRARKETESAQWPDARVPGSPPPGEALGSCPECGADGCAGECLDSIR